MTRWTRFRRLFGPDPEGDVEDELSFHIETHVRELMARGESLERARRVARQRFGDYETSRRQCVAISERRRRTVARTEYISELRQDVGYALRMLRRAPGFTVVAVVTLALGIGATTAIFSVVHGVLLAPLPFRDAEQLYQMRTVHPDGTRNRLSAGDFMSIRAHTRVFEQVEAYRENVLTLRGEGDPQEVQVTSISDGLLDLFGLPVAVGRGFLAEENQWDGRLVAVLDHGFWQRAFGGDRSVLGRTLSFIGEETHTIVGVLAPGAQMPGEPDVYRPLGYDDRFSAEATRNRRLEYFRVLGRATAAGEARIQDDLRRVGTELQGAFPSTNETVTFDAVALAETIVGGVRRPLLVLLGTVGIVLLVACANVANLLLARASARQQELAVRAALGGGRGRLVRQLLTEAVVLGLAGGAGGLAIAFWSTQALVAAQPAGMPRLEEVGLDGTVLLFALAVTLVTSLVFGTVPALKATGDRLARALREDRRDGGGGHRTRATLVVAEMALAVVLLMGAGLLIRSFVELTRVDIGFQPEQAMAVRLVERGHADPEDMRNRNALLTRLPTLPGVISVGATTELPLSGLRGTVGFSVVDAPPLPSNVNPEIRYAAVTPEYFRTIGTPLRSGRFFTDRDDVARRRVGLMNEAAGRRWFPGEDPVGRRVSIAGRGGGIEIEVVGVVADVLQTHPGEPAAPQLFVPHAQSPGRLLKYVVRTTGAPIALAPAIRAEVRALSPDLAVAEFLPLDGLVATSVARPRVYAALMTLFASVALALAAAGIFGVTSYTVAQRTREISIRMALGAQAADVLRMIVGRVLTLATIGAVLGIGAALALGRVMQSELFGVALLDPVALGAAVLLLTATAIAASALPARRAAGLDPASALREG